MYGIIQYTRQRDIYSQVINKNIIYLSINVIFSVVEI